MLTDPIADYLTRIRNAVRAGHRMVVVPSSNLRRDMTRILFEKGYILNYRVEDDGKQGLIRIAFRIDPKTKTNAIKSLRRVSKPGLRQYKSVDELPRVLNGLGIAIVTTSKGVMTDKEARRENVGGEVICEVY